MAEFAKHLYLNGKDLTPLSPYDSKDFFVTLQGAMKILKEVGGKDARVINDFSGDSLLVPTPVNNLLTLLPNKVIKKLTVLLAIQRDDPAPLEKGGEGQYLLSDGYSIIDNPFKGCQRLTYLQVYINLIRENLRRTSGVLTELSNNLQGGAGGTNLPGYGLESPAHPIKGALDNLQDVLMSYYRTIADGVAPSSFTDMATDSDYLEAILVRGVKHKV